jgi:hypothetical protein
VSTSLATGGLSRKTVENILLTLSSISTRHGLGVTPAEVSRQAILPSRAKASSKSSGLTRRQNRAASLLLQKNRSQHYGQSSSCWD